jgi:predicted AlkP superfamily pyrophosphatase or phosphodiesterase
MRNTYRWFALLAGLAICLGLLGVAFSPSGVETSKVTDQPGQPRLAVLLLFDQLRGDYLVRWDDLFEERGFHRLEHEGAWFQNCHYPYATTVTGAGHAAVATGCSPNVNGIGENDWYDRATATRINCAEGIPRDRYDRVPSIARDSTAKSNRAFGVAPDQLLVPTIGDAFMEATHGKSRIVSLSLKDRGAVLFAGKQPQAECYWFDSQEGIFVTSTYYRDRLSEWVEQFNEQRPADVWFGKDWTRLRPNLDYERYSGPDDVVGESKGVGTTTISDEGGGIFQGRVFPHPTTGGLKKIGKRYYDAVYDSPFGNELLLQLAKRAIEAEKLGHHDSPDLLCLSFSSNDAVGHTWGPDSQEVLDITLRTDRLLVDLLDYLDSKVGKGRYVVGLTADHGVCPLPEVSKAQGKDTSRIDGLQLATNAQKYLEKTFGKGEGNERWIESVAYPWFYLNRKLIEKQHLKSSEVESALAGWLEKQPGIEKAYTASWIAQKPAAPDSLELSVIRSYFPGRSGDVILIPKAYHLLHSSKTGTTHGTPHDYDTHVPLIVSGPGILTGVRKDSVTPQALPVILCECLGIKAPAHAEVSAPEGLIGSTKP